MNENAHIFRPWGAREGSRRAFTLVEALVSVLIVSGVLVASLGTLGAISKGRIVQVERSAATHLGSQMLAEIVSCYFKDPTAGDATLGPDAGETTRAAFDDVDDYNNWQASPPTLRDGTAMAGYTGWNVAVHVEHASLTDPRAASATATGLKRIRVTITTAGGAIVELSGVRSSNGLYEQLPSVVTNYLTGVDVNARVGDRGRSFYGGAHPLNITSSQ